MTWDMGQKKIRVCWLTLKWARAHVVRSPNWGEVGEVGELGELDDLIL